MFFAVADPETQWGDAGLSERAAVVVKKWFSKEYNLFFFFVPAEKKWKITSRGGGDRRVAEQMDPPLVFWNHCF